MNADTGQKMVLGQQPWCTLDKLSELTLLPNITASPTSEMSFLSSMASFVLAP